jgi:hypothetical protein
MPAIARGAISGERVRSYSQPLRGAMPTVTSCRVTRKAAVMAAESSMPRSMTNGARKIVPIITMCSTPWASSGKVKRP